MYPDSATGRTLFPAKENGGAFSGTGKLMTGLQRGIQRNQEDREPSERRYPRGSKEKESSYSAAPQFGKCLYLRHTQKRKLSLGVHIR